MSAAVPGPHRSALAGRAHVAGEHFLIFLVPSAHCSGFIVALVATNLYRLSSELISVIVGLVVVALCRRRTGRNRVRQWSCSLSLSSSSSSSCSEESNTVIVVYLLNSFPISSHTACGNPRFRPFVDIPIHVYSYQCTRLPRRRRTSIIYIIDVHNARNTYEPVVFDLFGLVTHFFRPTIFATHVNFIEKQKKKNLK